MNPLLLGLVGLPLIAGIYLRFKRFNGNNLKLSCRVSAAVMATVGVGFAFATHSTPKEFFLAHNYAIVGWGILLLPFAIVALTNWLDDDDGFGTWAIWVFGGTATILASPFGMEKQLAGVAAVFTLCALGIVNSVLGTVSAGFTLSATCHALLNGSGIDGAYLWKDIFEFFEISSQPLKVLFLIAAAVGSAGEFIHSLIE